MGFFSHLAHSISHAASSVVHHVSHVASSVAHAVTHAVVPAVSHAAASVYHAVVKPVAKALKPAVSAAVKAGSQIAEAGVKQVTTSIQTATSLTKMLQNPLYVVGAGVLAVVVLTRI